jgi:hypothetical protein
MEKRSDTVLKEVAISQIEQRKHLQERLYSFSQHLMAWVRFGHIIQIIILIIMVSIITNDAG